MPKHRQLINKEYIFICHLSAAAAAAAANKACRSSNNAEVKTHLEFYSPGTENQ
jgi:hypothetical protein